MPLHILNTVTREPHTIYERLIVRQRKDPRARIPRLILAHNSTALDKGKTERRESFECNAIFVKTGGKTDGMRESQTEQFLLKSRIRLDPEHPLCHPQ